MKRISLFTAIILVIGFTACEPGDSALEGLVESEIDVAGEAAITSSFEEIDEIMEDGVAYCNEHNSSGRNGGHRKHRFGRLTDCVEIDRDTVNQIITIDFGDGCEGPHGTLRSGIVRIAYNELRNVPGAYRIITFENFFVDSIGVEGTRTLTNTSEEADSLSRSFEVTLVDGKLTFTDSTTLTRDATHERTSYITEDRTDAYSTLTGEANGTLRNGNDYSVTIIEELVFKRGCREDRIVIPVSGVKEIVSGDNLIIIDYGDGTCDNLVDITINGETTTREIEPRGRKHRRR
ncbi:MAG: hypothetical protein RIC35_18375 [Marinoscillum sp.]